MIRIVKSNVIMLLTFPTIVFVILYAACALAQADSTLLDYYPLQIGNRWEYEDKFEDFQKDTTIFKYFSVEVIGDTLLPNQKRYQVLRRKSIPDTVPHEYSYERIDSTSFNIYRYDVGDDWHKADEFFIDSLRLIATGGEFIGFSRLHNLPQTLISYRGASTDTVLNYPTTIQRFHANDIILISGFEYWFARGLGMVYGFLRETLWRNPITLIYAEINGQVFGNPVGIQPQAVENLRFKLYQNFPNPFNPSTTIQYELLTDGVVELHIYNVLGQKIKTFFKGLQTAGLHKIEFNAGSLASGIYFYQIRSGGFVDRKKLILLR